MSKKAPKDRFGFTPKDKFSEVTCPYCKRKGTLLYLYFDGHVQVTHGKPEWKEVESAATGKMIRVQVQEMCNCQPSKQWKANNRAKRKKLDFDLDFEKPRKLEMMDW